VFLVICITAFASLFTFLFLFGLQGNRVEAASPPSIITYQGKLLQSSASVTTTKKMGFSIYDSLTGGNILYTASGTLAASNTVNIIPTNGVFSVEIGKTTGATSTNSLGSSIFQNNQSLYLEVIVVDSGATTTLSPRKQLTTAPYAFNSEYLAGAAATSTASTTTYIPISGSDGSFSFNTTTISNLIVSGFVRTSSTLLLGSAGGNDDLFIDGTRVFVGTSTWGGGAAGLLALDADKANLIGLSIRANSSKNALVIEGSNASSVFVIDAAGGVSASSSIRAYGNVTSTGILYASNGLISSASSTFASNLQVTGGVWASSTLQVTNTSTLYNDLLLGTAAFGHLTGTNNLLVNGQSEFDGTVWFDGSLRASSTLLSTGLITAYDSVSVAKNVTSTGIIYGLGGLISSASSSFGGLLTASGALDVEGAITASSTFLVGGSSGSDDFYVSDGSSRFGNTNASSSLAIYGYVTTTGNIEPQHNNAYDLGKYNNAWRNVYASGTLIVGGTGTSTFGGGVQTATLDVTSQSASSTFANGIILSKGCVLVGGTCLSAGGSVAGSDGQIQYNNGGAFGGASALVYDDGTNRVGINSSTPQARLSVEDTAEQFRLGYNSGNYASFTVGSNGVLTINPLASGTSVTTTLSGGLTVDSNSLIVDFSTNRVGISTSSPSALFAVGGNAFFSGDISNVANITATGTVNFTGAAVTTTISGGLVVDSTTLVADYSTSRVGIGNASPGAPLHVLTNSSGRTIRLEENSGGEYVEFGINSSGDFTIYDDINLPLFTVNNLNGYVGIGDTDPDGMLELSYDGGVKPSFLVSSLDNNDGDVFVINSSKYVGINSSTPQVRLAVEDTAEQFRLGYNSGNYASFSVVADGALIITTAGTDEDITLQTGSFSNALFIDDSATTVGINSSTPWGKFSVEMDTVNPAFVVANSGSSTPALFVSGVNKMGRIGMGTVAPGISTGNDPVLTLESASYAPSIEISRKSDGLTDAETVGVLRFFSGSNTQRQLAAIETIVDGTNEDAGELVFWTTPTGGSITRRMTILDTGEIGIGTTAPVRPLDVSASDGQNLRLTHDQSAVNYTDFLTNGSGELGIFPRGSAPLVMIDANSNTAALRLRGADDPVEVVDIYVGTSGELILNATAGTGAAAFIDLRPEDNQYGVLIRESDGTGTATYANLYVTDATDDYLTINVNSVTDGDALVITAADLVGVGTSTPWGKFAVEMGTTNPALVISNTGSSTPAFFIGGVNQNGHIGVGTSTLSQALTVEGSILASNLYGGAVNVTVDAGGKIIRDPSDVRLKENINTIQGALDKVLGLRGVSFSWKPESNMGSQTDFGLIAQEVEQVVPELVSHPSVGWMGVKYTNMVGLLIEAIKEQQTQIQSLAIGNNLQGNLNGNITADKLTVRGEAAFGRDTVGQAKILAGATEVRVTFAEEYEHQPIVTITLRGEEGLAADVNYAVVNENTRGFIIKISRAVDVDLSFNWHAFGSSGGKVFVSDGGVLDLQIVVEEEIAGGAGTADDTSDRTNTTDGTDRTNVDAVDMVDAVDTADATNTANTVDMTSGTDETNMTDDSNGEPAEESPDGEGSL